MMKKGAAAAVGYVESVFKTYNKKIADTLTDELLKEKTVADAFKAAIKKHGSNDGDVGVPTEFPSNSSLIILSSGLSNGDFEAGDLRGWDDKGDVRVLQSVGPIYRPQGKYMAILSTGLGAVNDSESIIEQTFTVPAKAKTLTFDYNWVSEEPREFVGSIFNDKMEIVWIPQTGSSKTIVTKDINSTTWLPAGSAGLGNLFSGGDNTAFQTGWKTITFNISAYQGKQVTLRARAWDIGDSIYDSACFLDNVTINE